VRELLETTTLTLALLSSMFYALRSAVCRHLCSGSCVGPYTARSTGYRGSPSTSTILVQLDPLRPQASSSSVALVFHHVRSIARLRCLYHDTSLLIFTKGGTSAYLLLYIDNIVETSY